MNKKEQCTYCGSSRNIEQDHIIARIKGGKQTIPACRACNRTKSDKSVTEFFVYVKNNDTYRWNRIVSRNKNKRNEIARKVKSVLNK